MAHRQLEGKIFSHNGTSYLVMSENDWTADSLKVKRVDARRDVIKMKLSTVLGCMGKSFDSRGFAS
jgi:hypothetical protein